MAYNFFDDFIFDAFISANHDSLLEEECISALQRTTKTLGSLIGSTPIQVMTLTAEKSAYAAEYPEGAVAQILDQLDLKADASIVLERLFQTPDFSLPYKVNSWHLKMYAMLGTLDISTHDSVTAMSIVEDVVTWAEQLIDTIMQPHSEPFFCFFAKAARARLDLDQQRHPLIEDFAALASLARYPHYETVDESVLDLPIKTIQNLISSKTLERFGDDRLTHSSAHAWLTKQWDHSILYPSKVFEPVTGDRPEVTIQTPVFVPVISGSTSVLEEAYLPEHSHMDGYHVEIDGERQVLENYWDALSLVQAHPNARVSTRHHPQYVFLSGKWMLFERSTIEEMISLESRNSVIEQATLCSEAEQLIAKDSRFETHRRGHSKKMLRYVCSTGEDFAVEKRPGRPLFYLASTAKNQQKFKGLIVRTKGPGPTERNSNLNTIESFTGTPLIVLRPNDLNEVQSILSLIATHVKKTDVG